MFVAPLPWHRVCLMLCVDIIVCVWLIVPVLVRKRVVVRQLLRYVTVLL